MPRALRSLVIVEAAAVIAVAAIGLSVPAVLPLFIVASASRWARGRSWGEVAGGGSARLAIGAAAGLAALALALVIATPVVEQLTARAVVWTAFPIVRGDGGRLVVVAIVVIVTAVTAELVLRGWLVERVLDGWGSPPAGSAAGWRRGSIELAPGRAGLAIGVGALAEALITPGDLAARVGAAVFGVALGIIYIGAGRSVLPGIAARAAFLLGALVLEALRVIG